MLNWNYSQFTLLNSVIVFLPTNEVFRITFSSLKRRTSVREWWQTTSVVFLILSYILIHLNMQTIFNEFANRKLKTNQNENIAYEIAFVEKYMTKLLKTVPLSFCFIHHNFSSFFIDWIKQLLVLLSTYCTCFFTSNAFFQLSLKLGFAGFFFQISAYCCL